MEHEAAGTEGESEADGVTYKGQGIGEAVVEAHSDGQTVLFTANSTLVGAKVDATGQAGLTGTIRCRRS